MFESKNGSSIPNPPNNSKDLILFSKQNEDSKIAKDKKKRDFNSLISEDVDLSEKPYKKLKKSSEKHDETSGSINSENIQNIDEKVFIAPWLTPLTLKIKNSLARLHNEIIDFYNYITPSEEEHNSRLQAIKR